MESEESDALLLYLINERIDFLEVTFLLVSEEHREDFVNDAHLLSFLKTIAKIIYFMVPWGRKVRQVRHCQPARAYINANRGTAKP